MALVWSSPQPAYEWVSSDGQTRVRAAPSSRGPAGPRGLPGPGAAELLGQASSIRALLPARKALEAGDASIVVLGDSNTLGVGASSLSKTWPDLVLADMRALYAPDGDKGSGYLPAAPEWFAPTYGTNSSRYGKEGDDRATGNGLDRRGCPLKASGEFVQWSVVGSTIRVFYVSSFFTRGQMRVTVDGADRGLIDTQQAGSHEPGKVLEVSGLSAAAHTVRVSWVSGTPELSGVFGTTGKGVTLWRGGCSGSNAKDWGSADWWARTVAQTSADLVVFGIGGNDMGGWDWWPLNPDGQAPDGEYFAHWLRVAVDKIHAAAPGASVIVLLGAQRRLDAQAGDYTKIAEFEAAALEALRDDPLVRVLPESMLWAPGPAGEDPAGWLADDIHRSDYGNALVAGLLSESLSREASAVAAARAAQDAVQSVADQAALLAQTTTDLVVASRQQEMVYDPAATYQAGDYARHEGELWRALEPEARSTTRVNPVPNPLMVTGGTAPWAARTTNMTSSSSGGAMTLTLTGDVAAGNELLRQGTATPAASGEQWTASVRVECPASSTSGVRLLVSIGYGAAPLTSPTTTAVVLTPGQVQVVTHTSTVPADKTGAQVRVQAGELLTSGDVVVVSQPIMAKGAAVGSFFHGGMADTATVDYAWEGAANASASIMTTTIREITGPPSVATGWVRVLLTGARAPVAPGGVALAGQAIIPTWMDRTRTRVWSSGSSTLHESRDDGATWSALTTFADGRAVAFVRELGNGELLVGAKAGANGAIASVFVSSGYPTAGAGATWSKVLDGSAWGVTFTSAWSVFVHDNIALVAEYGPKAGSAYQGKDVPAGENARYLYLSTDYGRTWRTIFDLNEHAVTTNGMHLHGVAWDRWWDRIWVSWGDDENGFAYSDDLGATWSYAHLDRTVAGSWQDVGILPMRDCILFGSDIAPNGLHRINRSQGRHPERYTVEVAYAINDSTQRTALCQGIFWTGQPEHPALFAFGSETNPGRSTVLATYDGYRITPVWVDDVELAPGKGMRSIIGPTLRGRFIGRAQDDRFAQATVVSGPAPY